MADKNNVLTLVLRHDIDFSLNMALELAKLECERGYKSTYFILLHNDFYNPLSPSGRKLLVKIKTLGHEIGLHWDSSLYDRDPSRAERQIKGELSALEDVVGEKIYSASQHVPIATPFLNVEHLIAYETYSKAIQTRFSYISDSIMSWRGKTPYELIDSRVDIHFLSHPIWWVAEGSTIRERVSQLKKYQHDSLDEEIQLSCAFMEKALAEREEYDLRFAQRKTKPS